MNSVYDIIVVGGGHAGCEAAMAAANLGSSVLLVSMDLEGFAKMSCNPAIGGIAKGQIVKEIDALGGYTGIVTDATTLQFRMLNRSKGPAMWSPRAQCDKRVFSAKWRKILENAPIGGPEFTEAAKNMQELSEYIADANYQFKILSTNSGSIKQVSAQIAELNRQWAEAGQKQKFNADGTLTGWAEGQVLQMRHLAEYTEKYGMSLEQVAAKRRELKEHEDALHNIGTTMSTLNQNLAAWRKELDSAEIDSPVWENAARMVALLSQKIKEASERVQELGLKTGSIEQMNAKIQSLVARWNGLNARFGADGKMTSEAKAIYGEFVKAEEMLRKEGQAMSTILQKQEALAQKLQEENRIRRRNQLVLSSDANTIDRIREKIRLLTDRLGKVKIGSGQFTKIAAEIDILNKKLAEAQGRTKELNAESEKSNTLLGNLLRKTLYLFGLHAITRFVQNIRQVTAEFELQQVALGAIIRDTERASDLFKQIKAAAIESPFEIKDLVSYTKQLAAYQIETDMGMDGRIF